MQLHELADVVDHLGVATACRRELADHARHLAEYGRVHEGCMREKEGVSCQVYTYLESDKKTTRNEFNRIVTQRRPKKQ